MVSKLESVDKQLMETLFFYVDRLNMLIIKFFSLIAVSENESPSFNHPGSCLIVIDKNIARYLS